mmetsp:Transcript_15870/g.19270  ORF Transcript_15870/g.19270 Transcript_15870/m.19270 type:complete len:157 (-) Transcript_15870:1556-2026(-)
MHVKLDASELARREARARRFQREKQLDPKGTTVFAAPPKSFAHPETLKIRNKDTIVKSYLERKANKTELVPGSAGYYSKDPFAKDNRPCSKTVHTETSSSSSGLSIEKQIRKVKKKLRQIHQLENEKTRGTLSASQLQKLARKREYELELKMLTKK